MALWETLNEDERQAAFELPDADRAELDRRWAEHLKNPSSATPWSEVCAKLQS
jgi:putative addiction module component (TIGR02574 family)